MKLLLDENLPHALRRRLPGHVVFTAKFMKWDGLKNGLLLAAAAADGFDAVLTTDAGIAHQQNRATLPCAVVLIRTKSTKIEDIEPKMPAVLEALRTLAPCALVEVS